MSRFKIAVLISGGGTTLKNLLQRSQAGQLDVDFSLVVASKKSAKGIEYASQANIDTQIISGRSFDSPEAHSQAVFAECRQRNIDLVVMGGYLEHLLIPQDFENRVINIHPSLIPAFSGKGFYGLRVHQAAIDFGVKLSGCTVHFVDNEFDHGPIIAQRTCPVLADDTPEVLQRRVFALESEIFPETIDAIARGRVHIQGRQVAVSRS